jgi:hypothetical protein
VNPTTLERIRQPSGAKTAAIDAHLLARKGRSDLETLQRLRPDAPLFQELKQLTRDQDSLIQAQTRLVNPIIAVLKADYPVALTLFGKVHHSITVRFLQHDPTLAAVQGASVEDLRAFLRDARHPHPEAKAQAIWNQVHQAHLQADPVTIRTKSRLLSVLREPLIPVMAGIRT